MRGRFVAGRSFAQRQALLARYDGQEVIIFGFSMLKGVTGTLDAAPPVSDYVRLRRHDGGVESIFVGDIWQLRDGAGNFLGQW
jgi:hypothetical protein